jgi:hypothetical protein
MPAEFPSNSKMPRPQASPKEEKVVDSVVTNKVEMRKKSIWKRFTGVFIGGDSRTVMHYILNDVLLPQAKDMITEAASQGFEKMIYGDARPGRRPGVRPGSGPTNYSRSYASRGNNPLGRAGVSESRRPEPVGARRQELDDILLATRVEADTVLDRLYDLLKEYELVSVSDLYSILGLSASYVDNKWGWTDLTGSNVRRVHDGYILELPKVESLD